MRKDEAMDMCEGPLFGKLLVFAVPLMFSGILQLLFNAADIIVVGQFTGDAAMAAVGSTSSLNNLIVNFFLGLSAGASVAAARYYGMRAWRDVEETVHTAILLGFITGLAMVFIGFFLARPLLTLMGTTSDVIDQSVLYMRIVFVGMPALMVYDFGAGILRAIGDTKRPLLFLFCGGVINVGLNLFFVIVCHMGVAGVAIGTVMSQLVSAVLTVRCLMRSSTACRLSLRRLRIVGAQLRFILRVGLPTGIQSAVFNISNVLIQSAINSFDSSVIVAGNTASVNIEGFVYTAMNAFYQATLTFTSQNVGAHRVKRILPIMGWNLLFSGVMGLGLGGCAVLLGRQLLGIYTPSAEVVSYGLIRLNIIGLTYFSCGLMDVVCASIRGLGPSITPTVISLAGACGLRIVWIYTVFAAHRTLLTLYLSYPMSWVVTFAANVVCFVFFFRRWKKQIRWKDFFLAVLRWAIVGPFAYRWLLRTKKE